MFLEINFLIFLTNENVRSYDLIILAAGEKMVNNEFEVAQTFKKYYRNVNQKNVWQMPLNVRPF